MITSIVFMALHSIQQAPSPQDITYGQVFFEETKNLELPQLHLSVGYSRDLNNPYLNIHSLTGKAQYRLWNYLSTGVFAMLSETGFTDAGNQLRSLKDTADLVFDTSIPKWGVYSLTQLQLLVGRWNLLNLFQLELHLLAGGGGGLLRRQNSIEGPTENLLSYLWSVEQRAFILENISLYVSFFGNRDAVYIHPGFAYSIDF